MRANTWKKLAGDFTIRRLTIVLGIVGKEILCVKKKKRGGGRKERAGETGRREARQRGKSRGTGRKRGEGKETVEKQWASFQCAIAAATSYVV